MTVRAAFLAASLLLLAGVPAASADQALPAPGLPETQCLQALANPPCGYIVPQLSLEFPDKPLCRAETLGGPVDLSKCLALPAEGETVTQTGLLRFSWDITQDGTYPADPQQPIVISFSGTATNPKWMTVGVEPAEVSLDAVALANPQNMRPDTATQQVWFWYEVPLTVTFERTATPEGTAMDRIERGQGVTQVFLKAKSSSSGAYYKEAFGVEEFRFASCNDPAIAAEVSACGGVAADANGAPAPGLLAALVGVGLAAVALRRRAA